MILAQNIEMGGSLLLRSGVELDSDRIHKLEQIGVHEVYVLFDDGDLESLKDMLVTRDNPPSYERLLGLARNSLMESIPVYARPEYCARTPETANAVNEIIGHTLDIVFSSRQCFDMLSTARMFQVDYLKHMPVAWVYALCTGVGLGYNRPSLLDLSLSTLFYDIGMTKVPAKVLAKPGRLTDLEYAEIKKHVFFGRRMLEDMTDFASNAPTVAFEHHENYYGGGYPKNKRGDDIHEFSQIVSLTDKFSAMLTAKNYRDRFQPYQAYEMLLAQTKSTVSPKVFVAFLKSVLLYPRGSMLRLSTGEIAQPVDFPLHLPTRPTVVVTHNSHGDEVIGRAQRTINLAEHTEITIDAYTIVEETTKGAQETQQENTARSFISRLR